MKVGKIISIGKKSTLQVCRKIIILEFIILRFIMLS